MDILEKHKLFVAFQKVIESSNWQARSEKDEIINEGWIELYGKYVKKTINSAGYLVTAARNELNRKEKGRFSVHGGAASLNETDVEGRVICDPAQVVEEVSKLDKLRSQLTDYELEFLDFVQKNGTAKIAKTWGCSQRKVQLRICAFVEQVRARLDGRGQGDLFGQVV